ncbi:MAG TPA: hypothetical protein VLN58_01530 [Verrucomicrobiae bacterium]|nr:hypothetical protein [Verrucomicrobiae bacterium]
MVENPFGGEVHLPLLTHDDARDLPAAFQMIQEIVMKWPINSIQRFWFVLWYSCNCEKQAGKNDSFALGVRGHAAY